jgi:hypothetical protein
VDSLADIRCNSGGPRSLMNGQEQQAIARLQSVVLHVRNLTETLPVRGEAYGYVFTEVDGVTVS